MKIITVNLPESHIRLIEEIGSRTCMSRSELLRVAIREFLIKELAYAQKLEEELEKARKTHIFDYCINCEKKLDNLVEKYQVSHQNYESCGLKFCYTCYKEVKDKTLGEFPAFLIAKIKKKIHAYKNYIEKSNIEKPIKETALIQNLEEELDKLQITHFFEYCINCERKLDRLAGKNHKFYKNFEIFELKFCCSCYTKFKDKSFNEFPVNLINRIKNKVKAYRDYKEKFKKINLV